MTRDEVVERHKLLHRHLDELFACFITEHPGRVGPYSEATLMEFMVWSNKMCETPTCAGPSGHHD